jgi:hypothetical protein
MVDPQLIGYSTKLPKGVDPTPTINSYSASVSVRYQSYGITRKRRRRKHLSKNCITISGKSSSPRHHQLPRAIKSFMDANGLVPGQYSSAHVRVLYALKSTPAPWIMRWTKNGLNCASNMRPGKPIFLASDSKSAQEIGVEYAIKRNAMISTHTNNPDLRIIEHLFMEPMD